MIKLEINEEKEYSIEELNEIRTQAWEISRKASSLITELQIEDYNYEHKFIHYKERGYMYVTWQKYEQNDAFGENIMFFQGMSFRSSLTSYQDESYFFYDALDEWRIPIDSFKRDIENGNIKEITKEEFMNAIKSNYDILYKEIEKMTNYLINK